jgi:hypothetical protein
MGSKSTGLPCQKGQKVQVYHVKGKKSTGLPCQGGQKVQVYHVKGKKSTGLPCTSKFNLGKIYDQAVR